ncbi:transcription intermediary factor 1-beta-like [Lytechinus pictus]|uniref:transcription intermediary factor 1-beta-like n=1 Tax=Lytechinus pictus TaxID=7653 RepID=UPI0030B9E4D3
MASMDHILPPNLQCPICLELLDDPKQLSCEHTFCKRCVHDLLACSSRSVENCLKCPVCQSTTDVGGSIIGNLNTNVPLKCLLEEYRSKKGLCEMCDKKAKAKLYCRDCEKEMCRACLKIHNKWSPNLKHEVISLKEIRKGVMVFNEKVYCQEHKSDGKDHVCTDVCNTCNKFICLRCRMLFHEKKGHSVFDAEEYKSSIRKEIEYLVDQGKMKSKTLNNHVAYVMSQMDRVIDHTDSIQAQINKDYNDMCKRLKERKRALDWQLYVQKKELCQRLEEMKDTSVKMVVNIEKASELAGYSLNAPLRGITITIHETLSSELKTVLDTDNPEQKFSRDIAERAEEIMFDQKSQCDQLEIGDILFVKCRLKCDVGLTEENTINTMAATSDGMMAVGYSTGGIDVFNADGQLQTTVLKDVNILGVGFLSDGRRVVLSTSNIMTLYTSEWEIQSTRFQTLALDEAGIADLTIGDENQIYISYRTAKQIQEFTPAGGNAIRVISCQGYEPEQICSFGNGFIIKSSSSSACTVSVVDCQGVIEHNVSVENGAFCHSAVCRERSILICSFQADEGILTVKEHNDELAPVKTLVCHRIVKPERHWFCLQQFRSGEIAFCTTERIYIFE